MTVDARYCPRCGTRLPGAPPVTCARCGYTLFVNPRPTANLVVVQGGKFLALKRAAQPHAGLWGTPGGFCDGWEHPADAAIREGREELGVTVRLDSFIGMYIGGYEYQGEKLPVLDAFYLATIVEGTIRLDPAESSDYTWFPLADPPPLAFATMDLALAEVNRLRAGAPGGTGTAGAPGGAGRGHLSR